MKINPNEPAVGYPDSNSSPWVGLTKREAIAKDCLVGLIGLTGARHAGDLAVLDITGEVAVAIKYADELIRQLNVSEGYSGQDITGPEKPFDVVVNPFWKDIPVLVAPEPGYRISDLKLKQLTHKKLSQFPPFRKDPNPTLTDLINSGFTVARFKQKRGVGPMAIEEVKAAFNRVGVYLPAN